MYILSCVDWDVQNINENIIMHACSWLVFNSFASAQGFARLTYYEKIDYIPTSCVCINQFLKVISFACLPFKMSQYPSSEVLNVV